MKILIVNTSDIEGGAARAAYRLHKALLQNKIDSQMLVQDKSSDDFTVIGPETKIQKGIGKVRPTIDFLPVQKYKNRKKNYFSPSWLGFSGIVDKINNINPDIVHLHWICGGMMTIEDIKKIRSPIIWSLHDNWAFTGGCHVKWECEKYLDSCGNCPALGSNIERDLSKKIWERKQKIFLDKNMIIIGLSKWLMNISKKSSLLKDKKHINLPNLIDTNIFKPFDRKESRELWKLPTNKKLILFGAVGATSDINKGFKELIESLKIVKSTEIELVIFGSSEPQNAPNFSFKTHYVGKIYDDISLVTLYNAVDVTIVPSLQENLSNVIMESLSCSTPVACFDVGGNSDMVEHQLNGYLARPFDVKDLAYGIDYTLSDSNLMKENSRKKILENFSYDIVAPKYINLYKEIYC